MLDAREAALLPPEKSRAAVLALISLMVFVAGAAGFAWSLRAREVIQWLPRARTLTEGPIRTQIMRYEASMSRGAVAFFVVRDDYTIVPGGARSGWVHVSVYPTNLSTPPTPQDRTNLRLAGFQWYHGVFPNQVPGLQAHHVHAVVLPLWPLVVMAIPPWRWWRRRRRSDCRGFSVIAGAHG